MAEILTESFCERCGTRYTFQATAPSKGRFGGRLRTLSKGLKNYVLSDETSLEEALADARSDEERAISREQLEAFHKTFNFCMSCRQYTCANCWNELEGRCLTCAPDLTHDVLPQAFPDLDPLAGIARPGDTNGARASNGHDRPAESLATDGLAWPDVDFATAVRAAAPAPSEPAGPEAGQPAVSLPDAHGVPEAVLEAGQPAVSLPDARGVPEAVPEATARSATVEPPLEPAATVEPPLEPPATVEPPQPDEQTLAAAPPPPPPAAEPAPAPPAAEPAPAPPAAEPAPAPAAQAARSRRSARLAGRTVEERAALAAEQTADLLARFRPGQSLDEAIAQYEALAGITDAAADHAPEPPAASAPDAVPAEAVHAEATPDVVPAEAVPAEAAAAAAAPAPPPLDQAAVPDLAAVPDRSAVQSPSAQPPSAPLDGIGPARRDDRVEAPVWRIVAPDTGQPSAGPAEAAGAPAEPSAPQWPTGTQWPTPAGAPPQWPAPRADAAPATPSFAAIAASRERGGAAGLWAASSQEVLAPATSGAAAVGGGVQACVSCGLPLSATARFCRRCGSRQG